MVVVGSDFRTLVFMNYQFMVGINAVAIIDVDDFGEKIWISWWFYHMNYTWVIFEYYYLFLYILN
jgi:hypothetical protein